LSVVGLIIHRPLDGAASLMNWQTGLLAALAVVAHDTSDWMNTILLQ
jgi:hypothetical protein